MSYNYGYDAGVDAGLFAGIMAFFAAVWVIALIVAIISIVGLWKIYSKAGEPGWAAIVPFYNTYVLFKITFGQGWMFLLLLVPIANVVFSVWVYIKLAKAFGKGVGFGIGLLFFPFIFLLILAFSDAEYQGIPA